MMDTRSESASARCRELFSLADGVVSLTNISAVLLLVRMEKLFPLGICVYAASESETQHHSHVLCRPICKNSKQWGI